ncbi:MAG: sulfurtransferase [Confluentimicrobium sp.]|jgi:rhodanese-related sulfurtransferase|uniref:rhodanese-like domain-containing protein n=1 Tax=Actibacterium sp. TaxID=1872125 RepID=UPI000C410C80|nr:rhodanese-like domain-containing protein [Actibacterium sp.]MBC57255.1 sulfurtransferase [Actibacterium sp.]MDY6858495.1 rhodanese-like domain-containing protein [Pseudomonadota bacterium]|tara:strand:- start:107 stop:475 length:369 start_codon:yes stop_codon:yes gene_type:complete
MFSGFKQPGPQMARIDTKDAIEKVAAGEMTLIDVREADELRMTGYAEGALHIPMMVFRMKVDPSSPELLPELSVDKPVALYCASGARSGAAAQAMMQMGYKEVYNLGGLQHWQMAGGPVTRG